MLKHSHDRKRSSISDIPVESNVIFTKKHSYRSIVSLRSSNGSQGIAPFMPLSLSMSNSNDNLMSLSDEHNMKPESLPDIDHHKLLIEVNFLYDEGLLYHKYCEYVHRQPFASHSAMDSYLIASNNLDEDVIDSDSEPRFRTWKEAQIFLSDNQFVYNYFDNEVLFNATYDKKEEIELPVTHKSRDKKVLSFTEMLLCLPIKSPRSLRDKYRLYAEQLDLSISSFIKVAKRSIKSVSLLAGMLTVRPISALNLPETNNKLHVKLSFGAISLMTKSVDNTICPTWGRIDTRLGDGKRSDKLKRSLTRSSILRENNQGVEDDDSKNDLELFIDAFGTNGVLRLAGKFEKIKIQLMG